ncbi:MAG TPA: NAD(P)-dependent oxidoreductase [Gemmatimonadales bacterium]|jgi:nucleoside-diphosphate-sugar epimerase|nr:NAD(P)-dependent oxidoreductase [Gemmatimonadales bacterium]
MKALVTGATGFVGSHLVEALRRSGVEVTALARSPMKASALTAQGVRVVRGDLHDPAALESASHDQEVIYHVAGVVAARGEAEFLLANREGTQNVVAAAERSGQPRFVLVSSLAAGGPAPRGSPLTGREPPKPVTAYGRSKLAAEQVVRQSGLPWSIVRPPIVYGPRDREVLKIFRIARLGIAPVFGDGSQELSAVHAADLANALIAAGQSQATVGGTYNACHPEVFTSSELGRAVGLAMGRSVGTVHIPALLGRALLTVTEASAWLTRQATILTTDKANEFFQTAWTGDPTALSRDSGWRATYDLRTGLADTYQWYRKAGWL